MSIKREKELEMRIQKARAELEIIREKKTTEQNLKLVGHCFKYRNSYSLPETESDYWWLYVKVLKVDDTSLLVLEFQTDKYGEISIKPETRNVGLEISYGTGNYIPIEASEFFDVWDRTLNRLKNIEI